MNLFQGKKYEELYWEKEKLHVQLYETAEQNRKLREQQEAVSPATVKEIKLEIISSDDLFMEPSLHRSIHELLKELVGQEVHALPYPLLYNLLQNRIVEDNKKSYQLNVEAVILSETLVYYLKVKKLSAEIPN